MSMNIKETEKKWLDACPEEARGMVTPRRTPKKWLLKIEACKNRKKLSRS
tara:strand:- start:350 stop:499 length:150 start_codon:yes stop_codon:yes gene_type:complete